MISTVELASTEIMSWEAGSANTRIRFEAQVMQDLDVFIEQLTKGIICWQGDVPWAVIAFKYTSIRQSSKTIMRLEI